MDTIGFIGVGRWAPRLPADCSSMGSSIASRLLKHALPVSDRNPLAG
jgi:hypothetical protein